MTRLSTDPLTLTHVLITLIGSVLYMLVLGLERLLVVRDARLQ